MPFLYRNHRKIYYQSEPAVHEKKADTIVLIHTNVTDHTLYDRIVPFLRKEYQIVRYDLAGIGLSELGEQEISLDLHVEDFRYLIQALHLNSFYIMAIGFGGLIALEYSRSSVDKVKKMALMTMPCFPEETLDTVRTHRRKISANFTTIPVDNILKKTTLLAENDPEYTRLHRIMSRQPVSTYTKMMDLTISANTLNHLDKNKTPTLILAGDREIVFPQNLLAAECAFLPGHQYTVVPNSSSFLMIDQPKITAALVTEFFKAKVQHGRYKDDTSTAIYEDIRLFTRDHFQSQIRPVQRTNHIQIDLLYSLRVHINGEPVMDSLNKRYAKNILIYLLFHPTTTREEICDHVWPQDSLVAARRNLRVYLSYLKRLLNSYSSHEPVLIADRNHIRLNADVTSDVLTLISDLHEAVHLEDERQKFEAANKILNRFSTPNYLTAIDDQWFLNIRAKVEHKLIHLIHWTGEWIMQRGEQQRSLQYVSEFLSVFENNIEIYDTLIQLSRKCSNEKQLQYWTREKARVWE